MSIKVVGIDAFSKHLDRLVHNVQNVSVQLNETAMQISILADECGFIARSCSSCFFYFKINSANLSYEAITCPSCGFNSSDSRWETPEQRRHITNNARQYVTRITKAAISGASISSPQPLLISEDTINVMRDRKWVVIGLPAQATELLNLERECVGCSKKFAFIGSAFFCPYCGLSSAEENFRQSITQIRNSVKVSKQLDSFLSVDEAANIRRAILEKNMWDLVVNFQLIAEKFYNQKSDAKAPINAFQRLEGERSGNDLWKSITGKTYADYIGSKQFERMRIYFQRRHLLAHSNGFVDKKYLDCSGDTSYKVGQRVVVCEKDIFDFAEIVEALVNLMRVESKTN